ncbi:MAG: tetraacyldisaccharide 4'-kinase, partial [Cyclobacteriaceae bacterium]
MWLLKVLLAPLALIYWLITKLRNHLFDIGYTKSFGFDRLVVAVGNLSVGGTGKTPMVEYLIRLLKDQYSIATLSRGYRRKSSGFKMAVPDDSAESIGDEPYQLYLKFKQEVKIAVGEERALAISSILLDHPEVEVILLDDAFQHRTVQPGLNILLTSFDRPFYEDHVLPVGRLREGRSGASRADVIVVTKCPELLSTIEIEKIKLSISKYARQAPVFFSRIKYASPKPMIAGSNSECSERVILVSGIASSQQLEDYVTQHFKLVKHLKYKDHHHYSAQD